MATYEGWKNYETWNVALYINNEYDTYQEAVRFMKWYKGKKPYKDFISHMGLENSYTPDWCTWINKDLAYFELNEMMKGLIK